MTSQLVDPAFGAQLDHDGVDPGETSLTLTKIVSYSKKGKTLIRFGLHLTTWSMLFDFVSTESVRKWCSASFDRNSNCSLRHSRRTLATAADRAVIVVVWIS